MRAIVLVCLLVLSGCVLPYEHRGGCDGGTIEHDPSCGAPSKF